MPAGLFRSRASGTRAGSAARPLLLLALPLEAGFILLNRLHNLGQSVVAYIAISFAIALFYIFSCWWITEKHSSTSHRSLIYIFLAGLAFRLTLLPLFPTLTEDPSRYRWEGKLQAAGGNPYVDIPEARHWVSLRDSTWPSVNRKDLPTGYGPVLELSFRWTYAAVSRVTPNAFRQVWLFKIPFVLFDLATAGMIVLLLTRLGLPREWLLVYFWAPLPVVEFWANGHNDPLLLFFLVTALWAASSDRWPWAMLALWLAVLTKFWPALLFPLFLWSRAFKPPLPSVKARREPSLPSAADSTHRLPPSVEPESTLGATTKSEPAILASVGTVPHAGIKFAAAPPAKPKFLLGRLAWAVAWAPLAALVSLPYWSGAAHLRRMLPGLLAGWRNNASLFNAVYQWSQGDFERAKPVVAALVLFATLLIAARRPPLVQGVLWTTTALLFLSANCFPWYLTWLLPLLAVCPNAALLLWTALVPLAYHILIRYQVNHEWIEDPFYLWLEYVPVFAMLLAAPLLAKLRPARAGLGCPRASAP